MGVLDLEAVFDILDPARNNYLTSESIQQYDELLHTTPMDIAQVRASIRQLCKGEKNVTKTHFIEVLQDIERRRSTEEILRWDFMGLDQSGSTQLPLSEGFTLFSMAHGDQFSLQTWQRFLQQRGENQNQPVYFDEIKIWLCDLPEGPPASQHEISDEKRRLEDIEKQRTLDELYRHMQFQDDEIEQNRQRQDHFDKMKKLAQRKMNRYEEQGVEGLLFDDGKDCADDDYVVAKRYLGLTELTGALQTKYDLIRKKLFWDMLQKGTDSWDSLSEARKIQLFQQLQYQERQMREEGFLDTQAMDLTGAQVTQQQPVAVILGEIREAHEKMQSSLAAQRMQLVAQGKSEKDADKILRDQFAQKAKGGGKSVDALIALDTRYLQEKEWIMNMLNAGNVNKWTGAQVNGEHCALVRQQMLAELEPEYLTASLAVGLAEREQEYKPDRFDEDRLRQEQLASVRLHREQKRTQFPYEDGNKEQDKHKSALQLRMDIVREVVWKHLNERAMMVDFLIGPESSVVRNSAKQLPEDQRTKRVTSLRNQRNKWREYSKGYRASQREPHLKILLEGTAIYCATTQHQRQQAGEKNISEESVSACVLADLQQKHDIEMATVIKFMQNKPEADLLVLKKQQRRLRKESVADTIAMVVLGTTQLTSDDKPFLEALDAKYSALRHLLFTHVLQLEHGVSFLRLPEPDRQKLIQKKQADADRLTHEGKNEELASIIERFPKELANLRFLMGEDKAEYQRRQKDIQELTLQATMSGKAVDKAVLDEKPVTHVKALNLLADLVTRAYSEEDAILKQQRSKADVSIQEKMLPLVLLHLERMLVIKEEQFDIGAVSVGLLERGRAVNQGQQRHATDIKRQAQLARLRVEAHRRRMEQGRRFRREHDDGKPEEGDTLGWMEGFLREMVKKHREEREVLMSVCHDPGMEELCEAAKCMSDEEKHKRLAELQAKRHRLDMNHRDSQDENIAVIEEAAALRQTLTRKRLESEARRQVTPDEVISQLLTEVQDEQDRELAGAVLSCVKMDLEDLAMSRNIEITARHQGSVDNVLFVLTRYHGSAQDNSILQALESKYNAVRDQLLVLGLRAQHGDEAWSRMAATVQQTHVLQAVTQYTQLAQQGKLSELARLMGHGEVEPLHKLLGQTRAQYEKSLQRMLADIPIVEEEMNEDEAEMAKSENPLALLHQRCEREKQNLLDRLKGTSGRIVTEADRHVLLARYTNEKRRATSENDVTASALCVGVTERQQANAQHRNPRDRARQERLASLRITQGAQSKSKQKENTDIVRSGETFALLDSVLQKLSGKHEQEYNFLLDLCKGVQKVKPAQVEFYSQMSEVERHKLLDELDEKRASFPLDKTKDQHVILQEAFMLKRASRLRRLGAGEDANVDDLEHKVTMSLLADLQEYQDMEAEAILQTPAGQTELIRMQESIVYERKSVMVPNVGLVLLAEEKEESGDEQALIHTLENKYDALRDKLIAEALVSQMGEKEWERLSEQERQKRMIELRLKERKLRKEGRNDEAAAILGQAFADKENIDTLLGIQRDEFDRRMKERLARRQQRLAEGFSEEEVDQLEQEEEKEFRKGRNLLADLDGVFEQEKAQLLAGLAGYRDASEAERARQLEIARLKREQRRVKEEEKFSTAALFISTQREQEREQEEVRKRQEELARERLQEKLRMRREHVKKAFKEVPCPKSDKDAMAWQEAVTKEMELKHAEERDFLISIMKDPQVAQFRSQAREKQHEAREARLEELKLKRRLMRDNDQLGTNQHMDLLREAVAYRLEVLADEQPNHDEETHQVALLADLQQQQDEQMKRLLKDAENSSVESLQQVKIREEMSRRQQSCDNVATVVLRDLPEGSGGLEEQLMDQLEKKYDIVLDKLLEQALRNQLGEEGWEQLTSEQQQEQLAKLKLQNRQLREEGRMDEANEILGGLLDDEDVLKQLGDSKTQQRQSNQDKLQRKRELIAERKAQGLSVDDPMLETILEEEQVTQPQRKRNVLEQLQSHFDDEKEALLAGLRGYEDTQSAERARQLAVARLKREQKRIQMAERYNGAAALVAMANEQGKARDAMNTSERDRMKLLAQEKLEARRRQMEARRSSAAQQLQAEEAARHAETAKLAGTDLGQGVVALQASVLSELQMKQDSERDTLADLVNEARTLPTIQTWLNSLKPELQYDMFKERKLQLERMRQERAKWRSKQLSALGQQQVAPPATDSTLSEARAGELANMREEQHQVLLRAAALRITLEKEHMRAAKPFLGDTELEQELSVALMAELQQKQNLETNALTKLTASQSEAELRELKDTQITSCREGWFDNLTNLLFNVGNLDNGQHESPKSPRLTEEDEKLFDLLDEEYDKEKDELTKKLEEEGKSGEEIEAACDQLLSKYDSRKARLQAVLMKQKTASEERATVGQQAQSNKQYEQEIAQQMSKLANREVSFVQRAEQDKTRSEDTLADKVAQRREQRRQARAEMLSPPSSAGSRPRSIDTHSPFAAMKREKTVVDVTMSDEQIAETQRELMRNMAASNKKLAAEQRAHEDRVQQRIQMMKEKRKRGQDEQVTQIFSNMERQKTNLFRVQEGEKERQKAKMEEMKDRRARSKSVERGEFMRQLQVDPTSSINEQRRHSEMAPSRRKTSNESHA